MTLTQPQRIILDTNVLVSALVFRSGLLADLREAWQTRRITPLVCRETVLELVRVLAYAKFRLNLAEQEALLADYLPFCSTIQLPSPLPVVPECRDPFDMPFLHLAASGMAQYLVTGDPDLLVLQNCGDCQIVAPRQFITLLKQQNL